VDCPGHSSLIRTVIGGAQIIDVVLLVVDAVKGWQAQTTECLVLAELCSPKLIVALNKIDQVEEHERDKHLRATTAKIHERLRNTRFANAPVVGVAACVGGEKVAASTGNSSKLEEKHSSTTVITTHNLDLLLETLQANLDIPIRNNTAPGNFYFAIDHCFPIQGRGTVLTGTCLSGKIRVNDMIEFPTIGLEKRKIKSMQMFKRQVDEISQGDRVGICVSNFDANLLERGIACSPGTISSWDAAIAIVRKVKYYQDTLPGNAKFHISVGHTTVMATAHFFGARELLSATTASTQRQQQQNSSKNSKEKDPNVSYSSSFLGVDATTMAESLPKLEFDFEQDYLQQDGLLESLEDECENKNKSCDANGTRQLLNWALLEFQTPVYCPVHSLVIGSRLDVDSSTNASACRLAFSGRLIQRVDPKDAFSRIKIYTTKEKYGVVSRLGEPYKRADDGKVVRYEVFGSDLFKKETNMKLFIGMKLLTPAGDVGEIKSSFGTSGQFRVYFPGGTEVKEGDSLVLPYKRYLHDSDKAMHQDLQLPPARSGNRVEVENKKKTKKKEPGVHKNGEVASLKGERLENGKLNMAIISGFFAPEINIKEKAGWRVVIPSTGEEGFILGPFGKAGKCKVSFQRGISANVGDKAELHF
jgi:selenocysteine-specific elongation factor